MTIEHTLQLTPAQENSRKKSKPGQLGAPVTRQAPPAGTYVPQPYPTEPSPPAQPDI